jgi:hypothetical protein
MAYFLSDLTSDDATHTYRVHGVVVPGVTSILNIVPPRSRMLAVMNLNHEKRAQLAHARDLGTAVHAACHYYDEGLLKPGTVDDAVRPYLEAWMRFKAESDFDIVGMETLVLHRTMGYAGRYDRKGHRRGKKNARAPRHQNRRPARRESQRANRRVRGSGAVTARLLRAGGARLRAVARRWPL